MNVFDYLINVDFCTTKLYLLRQLSHSKVRKYMFSFFEYKSYMNRITCNYIVRDNLDMTCILRIDRQLAIKNYLSKSLFEQL